MTDSMNENQKKGRGGVRPGAGRKKGSLEPKTIEKNAARDMFVSRVATNVDKLFNAQMNRAIGESHLMVKRRIGKGAAARTETDIITSPEIIKQFINGELDDTDSEYYYISTKPSDNNAIQGMLDRAFGRAHQTIDADIKSGGEKLGVSVNDSQLEQLIKARTRRSDS